MCVICRKSFSGEWFKCTNGECRYEAPRDLKSAPCILLKYLKGLRERIEWRRAMKLMLSGGVVNVLDVEDTLDVMVVDEKLPSSCLNIGGNTSLRPAASGGNLVLHIEMWC